MTLFVGEMTIVLQAETPFDADDELQRAAALVEAEGWTVDSCVIAAVSDGRPS